MTFAKPVEGRSPDFARPEAGSDATNLIDFLAQSGVPFLAVDYRLAPEFAESTPVEDVYAAVEWLVKHASSVDVDSRRIAVMGDSAGGGLAAGSLSSLVIVACL